MDVTSGEFPVPAAEWFEQNGEGEGAAAVMSVRAAWSFELLQILQRAVAKCLCPDPAAFDAWIHDLADELPAPCGTLERIFLRDRTREFAHNAGRELHRRYHREVPSSPCDPAALERADRAWSEAGGRDDDPRMQFARWATEYSSCLRRTHEQPVESRLARWLEEHVAQSPSLSDLARNFGCCRSTLERRFHERFGAGVATFQRRLRVQTAEYLLRHTTWDTDAVARLVGFRSTKCLYEAMGDIIGFRVTPGAVRRRRNEPACLPLCGWRGPCPFRRRVGATAVCDAGCGGRRLERRWQAEIEKGRRH